MNLRIEVVDRKAGGGEQRHTVLAFGEREQVMETLGMSLNEGKTLLASVQSFLIAQQVKDDLERRRACQQCGRRYTSKDSGTTDQRQLNFPNRKNT